MLFYAIMQFYAIKIPLAKCLLQFSVTIKIFLAS